MSIDFPLSLDLLRIALKNTDIASVERRIFVEIVPLGVSAQDGNQGLDDAGDRAIGGNSGGFTDKMVHVRTPLPQIAQAPCTSFEY